MSPRGGGRTKLPLVESHCSRILVVGYTLQAPEEFWKILIPSLTPRDFDLIRLGWVLGIQFLKPRDSNTQPSMRFSTPEYDIKSVVESM